MTDINALAKQAGFLVATEDNGCVLIEPRGKGCVVEMRRFAALVAAAEREECALECDGKYYEFIGPSCGEVRYGIATCSAAIRARGQA